MSIFPGKDGLIHISELADFRVQYVEDIVKVGDTVTAKCVGIDEKGRVKMSRRAVLKEREKELADAAAANGAPAAAEAPAAE